MDVVPGTHLIATIERDRAQRGTGEHKAHRANSVEIQFLCDRHEVVAISAQAVQHDNTGYGLGAWVAAGAYYATYEYLHWCMHLPRKRGLERSGVFFRLNGHHILHHRYMHKNFNVVFPLADLCLGTLLLRSKIAFPQPVHPAVPDLQPLEEKPALPVRVWRFVSLCLTGVK